MKSLKYYKIIYDKFIQKLIVSWLFITFIYKYCMVVEIIKRRVMAETSNNR